MTATVILGAAVGVLVVVVAGLWIVAALRGEAIRRLRTQQADLELRAAGLEAKLAEAARGMQAIQAAGDLSAMLASNVSRETYSRGDGEENEPICTACYRRVQQGRNPVQGCADCYWLVFGDPPAPPVAP